MTDTSTIEIDAFAVTNINWTAVEMIDWDKIEKAHQDKFFLLWSHQLLDVPLIFFQLAFIVRKRSQCPQTKRVFHVTSVEEDY